MGRYYRINITSGWDGSLCAMGQFQLKLENDTQINTVVMPHTSGNTLNGDDNNCSDGDSGSYWQYSVSNNPNWWKVDLGDNYAITKLTTIPLSGYSRNIKGFSVSVSNDDINWDTYLEATETSGSTATDNWALISPIVDLVNYLCSRFRDRMRSKGISLGIKAKADGNTSFLIMRHNRLRIIGVSFEDAKPFADRFPNIGGLLARYSASAIVGLNDNDPVSVWSDLSGNNNDFTQTLTLRPLYKTNIVNGQPALLFDGVNDLMDTTSITGIKTVIVVAKYTEGTVFGNYDGLITGTTGYIFLIGSSGSADFYPSNIGGAIIYKDGVATKLSVTNAWHVFAITSTTAVTSAIRMGLDRGNTGRNWVGYVAEICMYDNILSTADMAEITTYMKEKYGIV